MTSDTHLIPLPKTETFLTKVDPKALAVLFDKDPEELTKDDLEYICIELRAQRGRFEIDEDAKAAKPKLPKATKQTSTAEAEQLSLEDLGL